LTGGTLGHGLLSKSEILANARLKNCERLRWRNHASRPERRASPQILLYNGPANPATFSADFRAGIHITASLKTTSASQHRLSISVQFRAKKIAAQVAPIQSLHV